MQATLIDTPLQANPGADIQPEQLAHQLAENHTATISLKQRAFLPDQLLAWKETLQAAYACFRGAP